MSKEPLAILQQYWGFEQFRPLQKEVIQSVLDGKDTLALMPTGGGKSICFQVPALCQEGICLVISPLIALMKDQVTNLQKRNIPAVAIYSGMRYREIDRILDNCVYGNIKFLYLSPERLGTDLAIARIQKMKVNLIAVDESHCVSQWGYDFRPSYLEIANIRTLLPDVPVLALTATATTEVINDIQEKLQFNKANVLQKSFARKNLAYVVLQEEGKLNKMVEILKKIRGSGIVYARNRRKTKEIAQFLQGQKIRADFYHAGLAPDIRSQKQENWMANRNRIMVATNAFGMGIDKTDVRVVIHLDLPDSLEAYFQEAGRAGRDGQKSFAVLLYNKEDKISLEKQFELAFPDFKQIKQVYRALGSYFQLATGAGEGQSFDFNLIEFSQNFQLGVLKVLNCLKILEQAGWLVLSEAIFIPSTLKIIVSKDSLYDYQLKHPKMDKILKSILRTYQGAFNHFINIRENQLAQFLKVSRLELNQILLKLQQDGIIKYEPQKDQPQIIFLQERVDANQLSIDQSLYKFRKNRQLERMQKSVAYAEQAICRSKQLLSYFGEKKVENCGICDVCLGRTKADLSTERFEQLKTKIQRLLIQESLSLEEVVQSFAPKRENQVLKALEFLLDEGYIDKTGERLSWKKEAK